MNPHVTFPALLALGDLSLFVLRLVVAIVFGASGYSHLKDPIGRAKSVELSPARRARSEPRRPWEASAWSPESSSSRRRSD